MTRGRVGQLFLVTGVAGGALVGFALALLHGLPTAPIVTAVAVLLATLGAAWIVVDRLVFRPAGALAAELQVIAHGTEQGRIPAERFAALAPLPEGVNAVLEKLFQARRRVEEAVAQSTTRLDEQKSRLAAILNDLHDGVLVCNLEHQILLYNQSAVSLLGVSGELGLGRNLLQLVARDPLLHALDRLTRVAAQDEVRPDERHTAVLTTVLKGRALLQGRMGLVVTGGQVSGYVLTLSDATAELSTLGKCDALLQEVSEELRQPVANLRAAVETLADNPDLAREDRATFEGVVADQAQILSTRLERIATEYRSIAGRLWPMSDIASSDLIGLVAFRAAQDGCEVTMIGLPQWLHGDTHSLTLMLGRLVERLARHIGLKSFDMSAEPGESWVYIDISWAGAPVPVAELAAWSGDPLEGALQALTIGDILNHHHSDLWSEAVAPGEARLRIPLPPAARPAVPAVRPPPRPEFFDFDLLHQPIAAGARGRMRLDQLSFVVFDTETTGLNPSGGDKLISIGAVRIVNGRILTGENFHSLVNPKRPIPAASVRFHGITEEMVRDCPAAEEVLPAFKAFVDDAVLVAHNAAFDLKFLKMSEKAAGVRFDNPVLDTLILSRFVQGDGGVHSLDGLTQRLGIEIVDRHSALGDAFATAAVFLRLIEMLKERGVLTLEDAIRRSNMLVELHARSHAF